MLGRIVQCWFKKDEQFIVIVSSEDKKYIAHKHSDLHGYSGHFCCYRSGEEVEFDPSREIDPKHKLYSARNVRLINHHDYPEEEEFEVYTFDEIRGTGWATRVFNGERNFVCRYNCSVFIEGTMYFLTEGSLHVGARFLCVPTRNGGPARWVARDIKIFMDSAESGAVAYSSDARG